MKYTDGVTIWGSTRVAEVKRSLVNGKLVCRCGEVAEHGSERNPMRNMTKHVLEWLRCSNDVWVRHFASRDDGFEEFAAIEAFLFTVMVGPALDDKSWSLNEFIGCLQVKYLYNMAEERQWCVR